MALTSTTSTSRAASLVEEERLTRAQPVAKKLAKAIGSEDYNILQNNGRLAHQVVDHVRIGNMIEERCSLITETLGPFSYSAFTRLYNLML